ncbi:MAG TPA: universal stress protein [Microbacterium sp.]|uniref:universal stress protein n=1 Tax=Microbacterium sp. TaxID=51671 RepID=UPI002F930829
MTDEASEPEGDATSNESLRGAVIAGVIPDQSPRVLKEAARYAKLFQAPLVVVHVDVTRFVTYEDPDGYVHSAPIDINIAAGEGELAKVQDAAASVLGDAGPHWTVRQLVGDPAMAIKHFADEIDARLIVVGTRKRGFGESVREFFTGSVGARLAHRQHRSILIVPLGEPVPDDEEIWPA